MTWSYSGNPAGSTSDAVRFWIGDTNEHTPQLSDEEIAYLLALSQDNVLWAAIGACIQLANRYSSQVDFAVETELRVDLSQRAEAYAKRAKELQQMGTLPGTGGLHPMPYAGGISWGDKERQTTDGDRVAPSFWVGMHEEHGADLEGEHE